MSTKKYHLGKNGPMECKATKRACRYGGDDTHYTSIVEAAKVYETNIAEEEGGSFANTQQKSTAPKKSSPQKKQAVPHKENVISKEDRAQTVGALNAAQYLDSKGYDIKDEYGPRFIDAIAVDDGGKMLRQTTKDFEHDLASAYADGFTDDHDYQEKYDHFKKEIRTNQKFANSSANTDVVLSPADKKRVDGISKAAYMIGDSGLDSLEGQGTSTVESILGGKSDTKKELDLLEEEIRNASQKGTWVSQKDEDRFESHLNDWKESESNNTSEKDINYESQLRTLNVIEDSGYRIPKSGTYAGDGNKEVRTAANGKKYSFKENRYHKRDTINGIPTQSRISVVQYSEHGKDGAEVKFRVKRTDRKGNRKSKEREISGVLKDENNIPNAVEKLYAEERTDSDPIKQQADHAKEQREREYNERLREWEKENNEGRWIDRT